MNKQEAIKAMRDGKKLTHTYFTSDEWVTIEQTENGERMLFEDGVKCPQDIFWDLRPQRSWDTGWELFKEKTIVI